MNISIEHGDRFAAPGAVERLDVQHVTGLDAANDFLLGTEANRIFCIEAHLIGIGKFTEVTGQIRSNALILRVAQEDHGEILP